MGMTLWMQTCEGDALSEDSDDYSLMYVHADALDARCVAAGVRTLSSFFDTTDLEYNLPDDDDDEDDEALELDPVTGLAYGIDDMQWFDPAEGLRCLRMLHAEVAQGAALDIDADARAGLLDELNACIGILAGLSATARFHLAVIM